MNKLLITLVASCFFALSSEAQIINFSDSTFKQNLLAITVNHQMARGLDGHFTSIDKNQNGEIEQVEADSISELYYNNLVSGTPNDTLCIDELSLFTNLHYLSLDGISIDHFTFSNHNHLRNLKIFDNKFDFTIHLENLPGLDSISFYGLGKKVKEFSLTNVPLKYLNVGFLAEKSWIEAIHSLETLIIPFYNFQNNLPIKLDLSQMNNLRYLDINNKDLHTIYFPVPNKIEYLDISDNFITSFDKTGFNEIKDITIDHNYLKVLDLSGLSTLETLDCSSQNNLLLSELYLEDCNNLKVLNCERSSFDTLDLSGLPKLESVNCSYSGYANFPGVKAINLSNCPALKNIDASNSDKLETLDASDCPELELIEAQLCELLKNVNLSNSVNLRNLYFKSCNSLETLDLSCITKLKSVDILDGTNFQYLNIRNKTNDGDKFWYSSKFKQNINISVDPEELEFFTEEFPEAKVSPYFLYSPPCKWTLVTGSVLFDVNNNGCVGGKGISDVKISHISALISDHTFTNTDGHFSFYPAANQIDITPAIGAFELTDFGLSNPVQIDIPSDTDQFSLDFCLSPIVSKNDLEIQIIALDNARPGFDASYKIVYTNKGSLIQSSHIALQYEENVMELISSSPGVDSTSSNYLIWNYTNLLPFESREILIKFTLNTPADPAHPLNGGDFLYFVATIYSETEDIDLSNNRSSLLQTIVNSFDPNDKTCLEGEYLPLEDIGKFLHYLIRFENTGTAEAVNVVVRDVIDTTVFDASSFWLVASSHKVNARMTADTLLEFIFEDIYLPFNDSINDGYVLFKIRTRSDLQLSDQLKNDAEIYFDYNLPILTNTAVTTVGKIVSLEPPFVTSETNGWLFPNPANNRIEIKGLSNIRQVEIYSMTGQLVRHFKGPLTYYPIEGIPTGVYVVRTLTDTGTSSLLMMKN